MANKRKYIKKIINISEQITLFLINIIRNIVYKHSNYDEFCLAEDIAAPIIKRLSSLSEFDYRLLMERKEDTSSIPEPLKYKTAIVMQGPIIDDKAYTINTALWYRKLYPDAIIIISTWIGESEKIRESALMNNIICQENAKPDLAGRENVNYQLISTKKGIEIAIKHGAQRILKTRNDQRFRYPSFLNLFEKWMEIFENSEELINKIIVPAYQKDYPFMIGDYYSYSSCEVMRKLFSIPIDKCSINREILDTQYNRIRQAFEQKNYTEEDIIDWRDYMLAESYIFYNYWLLNYEERKTKNPVNAYKEFIGNQLLVLDENLLRMHWSKYDRSVNNIDYRDVKYERTVDWITRKR